MLTMTFSVRKISRFSFSCSRARACLCYDNGAFCVTTTENASDAMRLEMIICDNERSAKLLFRKDESFEYAEKIENLIKQTNK